MCYIVNLLTLIIVMSIYFLHTFFFSCLRLMCTFKKKYLYDFTSVILGIHLSFEDNQSKVKILLILNGNTYIKKPKHCTA